MAHEIFKQWPIDIHSGGCDLKFPHHDNEIAQSEAYYSCDNWINNFWHTGHLHIAGKKMSKSLKNFTTIKQILEIHSARQIRFLFLIHQWNTLMNYDQEKSFQEAIVKEKQFDEFFKTVKAILRQCDIKSTNQKWEQKDYELDAKLREKQASVREAICDDFNTPKAIGELFELVTLTNGYLSQEPKDIKEPLVRSVSKFVFHILKCFGIYQDGDYPSVAGEEGGVSQEEAIAPLMNALSKYRD
jgi:cysteinyl-tRNA synthetase